MIVSTATSNFLSVWDDADPRIELLQGLSILWMGESVDDWVIGARGLGKNDGQFANKRSNLGRVAPSAKKADDSKRCP